jgi:hypothetical protein
VGGRRFIRAGTRWLSLNRRWNSDGPEVTVEALRVLRPVGQFMGESSIVALGVAEGFKGRHLHII